MISNVNSNYIEPADTYNFNKTPNDLSPENFRDHKLISSYKSNYITEDDDGLNLGYNLPMIRVDQEGHRSSNNVQSHNETEDDMITYLNPEPKI